MSHDMALVDVFDMEYALLAITDQRLVQADFAETVTELRTSTPSMTKQECATEYKRRIGEGNLQSYADSLMAGARRKAREFTI